MGAIVAAEASGRPRRRRVHGRLRARADRGGRHRLRRLDRRVRARAPGDRAGRGARGARCVSTSAGPPAGGGAPAGDRRRGSPRLRRAAATAVRRRPRSPERPASRSRSSIATSPRSGSSTWPASRRRGRRCGTRSTRSSRSWATVRRSPRSAWRRASSTRPAGSSPSTLWIQALTEAGGDEEIRELPPAPAARGARLRRRPCVRRAQAAGGVPADRDPDAEAWIFVGAALLISFADRLGGLLGPDEFSRMATERRRWLTGSASSDVRNRRRSWHAREAKPTLQGSWRGSGSALADPEPVAPRSKRRNVPGCGSGDVS